MQEQEAGGQFDVGWGAEAGKRWLKRSAVMEDSRVRGGGASGTTEISIYMNASRGQVVKSRTVCVGTAPRSVWREPGANKVPSPWALLRLTTR